MTKIGDARETKRKKNSGTNDFLQQEINRLGILLKAEQTAHEFGLPYSLNF